MSERRGGGHKSKLTWGCNSALSCPLPMLRTASLAPASPTPPTVCCSIYLPSWVRGAQDERVSLKKLVPLCTRRTISRVCSSPQNSRRPEEHHYHQVGHISANNTGRRRPSTHAHTTKTTKGELQQKQAHRAKTLESKDAVRSALK